MECPRCWREMKRDRGRGDWFVCPLCRIGGTPFGLEWVHNLNRRRAFLNHVNLMIGVAIGVVSWLGASWVFAWARYLLSTYH